jgi:hypothetical protein
MCSCWGSVDGLIVRCASASALQGDCASELGTQQSDINVGDHDVTEASRFFPMEPLRRVEQQACLLTEILNKESYSHAAAQALAHNLIAHAHIHA